MKANVYNEKGDLKKTLELPAAVFGAPWNADLVHQVVNALAANKRASLAKTKGRQEVRGGGKRPWAQKGTGRARHSSIRSPLWRGGGITHGPTPDKIYKQSINARMKAKALAAVLSEKLRDNEIIFLDKISLTGKTREAAKTFAYLSKVKGFDNLAKKKSYLIMPKKDEMVWRSFKNLSNASFDEARNINSLKLLENKFLVFVEPEGVLEVLESKM
ncbi:MAG TPA: 50S ribosomal protein L4 [Candidatus Paceibacterota bacterium]|uniref:Large ribosomal subunit protein uL4 n=1 Tax=uncultured Parcubacteria bacterium Rifle_16ft_4_minimus_7278 TaxID=1665143 RepID=A0A0H4TV07_9BACT|nr:50S ribosomal protein L4, large subunit ribosomal protein L4 [uncultured Parcubacteria bacterium Rifle_16ft_4_minimus_7278]HXK34929.1 50S ribosomal protein L4 [Candidatus Paceibacterota bacterium]